MPFYFLNYHILFNSCSPFAYFLYLKDLFIRTFSLEIFAAYSKRNKRPKIQKIGHFNKSKNMNDNNEIKEWQTQSVKHKVAFVLITDGISFSYTEEGGIVFSAPDFYVEKLAYRLMTAYGCSMKPIFTEIK